MKSALLTVSLAALTLIPNTHAAWQRLGGLEKCPVDIASSNHVGTKIASAKGIGQPENLISDDVAVSSKLNAGASEAVISLGRQSAVETINLTNQGTEGRISVEGSIDNHKWMSLAQAVFTAADRSIPLRFAAANVSYVKIQFDLAKGGSMKDLDIFGSDSDNDFKVTEAAPGEPSPALNVAGGLGGSRVIYINPSPSHGDESASKFGSFEFPESPDKFRTVIYDFGQARTLTEIGSVHSPRPVRFYAYAFEKDLPEKEDWRGRMSFDPSIFDGMTPVATAEDTRGIGYIKTKLSKSVRARYVALRWEPDFNPPAFVVSHVTISASGLNAPVFSPNTGSGGGGGGGGANDNPQGQFNGTPFSNPFSIGTGGYGSPGAGPNGGSNPPPAPPRRPRPTNPFASP